MVGWIGVCGYAVIPSGTSAGDDDACDAVRRWRVGAAATLFVLGTGLSYAITHLKTRHDIVDLAGSRDHAEPNNTMHRASR